MTPAEKLAACMRLAEFAATRHDGRREYEWKVTLGLWGAIIAAIATFRGESLPSWLGPLTLLIFSFVWLRGVWVANEKDKALFIHYRTQAERLLTHPSHHVEIALVTI